MADDDLVIGLPAPGRPEGGGPSSAAPPLVADFTEDRPAIPEATVRGFLASCGVGLGWAIGDPDVERHWRFRDDELDAIAPALTRMAGRNPKLAAAIERGDEITVGIQLSGYFGRNVRDWNGARRARKESEFTHDGQPPDLNGEAPSDGGGPGADARNGHGGFTGDRDALGVRGPATGGDAGPPPGAPAR